MMETVFEGQTIDERTLSSMSLGENIGQLRRRQGLNGLLIGRGLLVVGMDSPEERLCHLLFHLFFLKSAAGRSPGSIHLPV